MPRFINAMTRAVFTFRIAQGGRSEVACETLPFAEARIALRAHDDNVHRFFTINSP